jgi:hypothetical protein
LGFGGVFFFFFFLFFFFLFFFFFFVFFFFLNKHRFSCFPGMDVAIGVGVGVGVGGAVLVGLVVWRCIVVCGQDRELPPLSLFDQEAVETYVLSNKDDWLNTDEALFAEAGTWRLRKNKPVNADGVNLSVRETNDRTGNPNNLFWYYAETSIPISPTVASWLFGTQVKMGGWKSCLFLLFLLLFARFRFQKNGRKKFGRRSICSRVETDRKSGLSTWFPCSWRVSLG